MVGGIANCYFFITRYVFYFSGLLYQLGIYTRQLVYALVILLRMHQHPVSLGYIYSHAQREHSHRPTAHQTQQNKAE